MKLSLLHDATHITRSLRRIIRCMGLTPCIPSALSSFFGYLAFAKRTRIKVDQGAPPASRTLNKLGPAIITCRQAYIAIAHRDYPPQYLRSSVPT